MPPTPALIAVDASGGVEAGTEKAVALARARGIATLFVWTSPSVRTRIRADARRAAGGRSGRRWRRSRSPSRRGGLRRLRRPGAPQGLPLDGKRDVEIPVPAELSGEVDRRAATAARGGLRGGRRRADEVPRGEEVSDEELDACLHKGVRERSWRPSSSSLPTVASASTACLTRSSATCPRRRRSRRRRHRPQERATIEVARTRPGPCWCGVQDAPPILRRRLTYLRAPSGTLPQPEPLLERARR